MRHRIFQYINSKSIALANYINTHGHLYQKHVLVRARPAVAGEVIDTIVGNDKLHETSNTAKQGDWIVTNPKGEKYIIADSVFKARYTVTSKEGEYQSKGLIKEVSNPFLAAIKIIAPWKNFQYGDKRSHIAVTCDDQVCSDQPYLIEDQAFNDTYKQVNTD